MLAAFTVQLTDQNWWMFALGLYIPSAIIFAMIYQRDTIKRVDAYNAANSNRQIGDVDLVFALIARINWGLPLTVVLITAMITWGVVMTILWPFIWLAVAATTQVAVGRRTSIGWFTYITPSDVLGNWLKDRNIAGEGCFTAILFASIPTVSLIGCLVGGLFPEVGAVTGALVGAGACAVIAFLSLID